MRLSNSVRAIAATAISAAFFAGCSGMRTQSALPVQQGIQAFSSLGERPNGCSFALTPNPNPGVQNILRGVKGSSATDMWGVGRYFTNSQGPLTLAEHWNGATWSQVTTPNPSTIGNGLNDVVALSSSNAWAVGVAKGSYVSSPLILHWNGKAWKQATAPSTNGLDTILLAATGISPSNVWAVGRVIQSSGIPAPYASHFNGKKWSAVTMPNLGTFGSVVTSVAMTAGTDVWAFGGTLTNASGSSYVTFAEHFDGHKWSIVKTPNANSNDNLFNVGTAVTTTDAWAIGDYYTGKVFATLTEHWDGKSWKIVASPNVKNVGNGLYGAASSSSKDVWAVGSTFVGSAQSATLTLHWNGKAWAIASSPNVPGAQDQFNAAAFSPKTGTLWTVGYTLASGTPAQSFVARKTCAP